MLTTSVIYTTYWYIQHIGIYNILVYTTYWYLQHIGIYNILVFTTYWYIQHIRIYNILVLTTYWYIYNILVFTTYWYIQHIGIYNILVFTAKEYHNQRQSKVSSYFFILAIKINSSNELLSIPNINWFYLICTSKFWFIYFY